ncbi:diacylglycerol/lipid kinase family protein [Streptacidiphilus anmyonensis]|uniref:diacylglycerol/lipid kinase family protein n=1 Tax=Streptacidiphilus anmyonensis TaxID=405782 RepID=UPI0005A7A949|nr:diacylglycerol kinase family protein [Streptacidiphilus anmyonensis]
MLSARSRARLLAWLALLAGLAAVVVLVATAGLGGLLILLLGLCGLVAMAVGLWLTVAHRGVARWIGVLLAVGALVVVLVGYTRKGLWPEAVTAVVLWAAAALAARSALRTVRPPSGMRAVRRPRPKHPVLIMNPRSGGGKVGRFGLVEKAEALGAEVVLLDTSGEPVDVTELARRAVAEGADLLGVAGGDGTQALVAAVAAEHGLPFLVLPAGTRNHFAMDLGLDRADPSLALAALTDGEELLVDLGTVSGRPFVNTVSFGVYAQIVQSPEYRDAKTGTALEQLPDLLLGYSGERLDAVADENALTAPQALLVSNNPYAGAQPLGAARRPRLDRGVLGVVGVRVANAAQAAEVALLGRRAAALTVLTAHQVTVDSPAATIPVGVDGEALRLPTPVTCTVRPGALRALVPRRRPGVPPAPGGPLDWRRLVALALGSALPSEADATETPGTGKEARAGAREGEGEE